MKNANPFIRFNQAVINSRFEPDYTFQQDVLDLVYNDILVLLASWASKPLQQIINELKAVVAAANQLQPDGYGGNVVLNYPKPWVKPTTGTDNKVFTITSPQLFAFDAAKRIEVSIDLINGIADGWVVDWPGVTSLTANYDPQIIQVEKEVQRALIIREQTGSSFLPLTYQMISGVAYSGLARGRDWEFVETNGYPIPSFQLYPFAPAKVFQFEGLKKDERFIVNLTEKVINNSFKDGSDIASLIAYVDSLEDALLFPDSWSVTQIDNTTDLIEFTFSSTNSDKVFKLVGQFNSYSKWIWQRFVSLNGNPNDDEFIVTYSSDNLPLEGDPKGVYFDRWFDFEYCQFVEPCTDNDEPYYLPAKPGDELRFNILPEQGNLFGKESCKIGIVDCNGIFKAEVGIATLPECFTNTTFEIFVSGSAFGPLLAAIISNSADTTFSGVNESGTEIFQIDVPFASTDTTNITDYAQSVIDFINGLGGYVATFDLGTNLTFSITVEDSFIPVVKIEPIGILAALATSTGNGRCLCSTQYQASITIPALPNGVYNLILYFGGELYSISEPIKIDSTDCFSRIIEFKDQSNSIREGFEYFNDWSQMIRIGLNGAGQTPIIEESIYRNSDGTYQRPSSLSDLSIDLQTDYIDLNRQKALFAATRHPVLIWENQNIFVNGDLEVATTQDFSTQTTFRNLSQMKFRAFFQGYQPENNGCIGC